MDETQQTLNQNPITPPPNKTYPMTEPNSTSKTPWMLFSLIIILIGVTSYFGYQNYQLKQQLAVQQPTQTSTPTIANSPIPTISTASTINSMENWKTYTSSRDKLAFEIKYPPTVQVSKEFNDQNNRATEFLGDDIIFTVMLRSGYGIDIKNYFFMDAPITRTATVAGVSANVYEMPNGYCDGPGCSAPFIAFVTVNGPELYHISFYGDTKLSEIENQILSSFKFNN